MNRVKKFAIRIALLLVTACFLLSVGYVWFYRANALGNPRSRSGIRVPTGEILPTLYLGDTYQLTEVKVSEGRREQFVEDNPFRRVTLEEADVFNSGIDLHLFFIEKLPNAGLVELSNELYFHTDCKNENAWTYLFDKDSGYLWIVMQFPDMSGDFYEC